MTADPHWDFTELLIRLRPAPRPGEPPEYDIRQEAVDAIAALMATNQSLHRRAQEVEGEFQRSHLHREVQTLKWHLEHYKSSSKHHMMRMSNAFQEVKRIYEHLRRARPDGCDGYGYHSVNDMKFGGDAGPGEVWANVYESKRGGIVSVRPAEIVGPLIDELIAFRKFFGDKKSAAPTAEVSEYDGKAAP